MNLAPSMMSIQPLIAHSDNQHQSPTLKTYLSVSVDTRTQTLQEVWRQVYYSAIGAFGIIESNRNI